MPAYSIKIKLAATFLAGCVAFLAFSSNADAGPPEKGPALEESAESSHDWTGFYMGANLGGVLTDFDEDGPDDGGFFEDVNVSQQFEELDRGQKDRPGGTIREDTFSTFFVPSRAEQDGAFIGGGQIGYQHQFGHFVVGIEGSFDRTAARSSDIFRDFTSTELDDQRNLPIPIFFGTFADTSFAATRKAEMNWMGAVTAKLGYAHGPFLFYGIGGASWADVTVTSHDIASTDFVDVIFIDFRSDAPQLLPPIGEFFLGNVTSVNRSRHNEVRTGWTAGGGIEIAFSRVVSLGLEYRHADFGDDHDSISPDGGPIFPGSSRLEIDTDQVTVKFNVNLSHFFGK